MGLSVVSSMWKSIILTFAASCDSKLHLTHNAAAVSIFILKSPLTPACRAEGEKVLSMLM